MKKKTISVLLLGIMTLSLAACGSQSQQEAADATETVVAEEQTENADTEEVSQEAAALPEAEAEPVPVVEEAESMTLRAFDDLTLSIPSNWTYNGKSEGGDNKYYFFPESGQVDGQTCSMLMLNQSYSYENEFSSEEEYKTMLNNIAEGLAQDEEITVNSSEFVDFLPVSCMYINYTMPISEEDFNVDVYVFIYNKHLYNLTLMAKEDFHVSYDHIFDEIVSSMELYDGTVTDENISEAAFKPTVPFFGYTQNNQILYYCIENLHFDTLETLLTDYVNEYQPGEEHASVRILSLLSEYPEVGAGLVSEYDSFEDKYYIHYEGYTGIDSSHYVYPYASLASYYLQMGFVRNGWLFAEDMMLKRDSETENDGIWFSGKSYDFERDVLKGSSVREYKEERLYDSDVEYLSGDLSENMTLRFENDKGENLDYVLTDTDKAALHEVANYAILCRKILDIRLGY